MPVDSFIHPVNLTGNSVRVGLFTDTYDEINGVSRFLRDLSGHAIEMRWNLTVHTCHAQPMIESPARKNFTPLLSRPMPYQDQLRLNIPPFLQVLEWTQRQQFHAIHLSTPGPMGICGWIIAKMLDIPMLGTYHTDFPAYVQLYTGDQSAVLATTLAMKWFYGQMARVFARSREYLPVVRALGVGDERLRTVQSGVNTTKFNPQWRDTDYYASLGVGQSRRILYSGRISSEKNLPLLTEAFKLLCRRRNDVALVVAGDGPYRAEMKQSLANMPVYFLGFVNDQQLSPLYASADLFAFPSRTDTLGQAVIEAQASGLPALVSDEGGPRETVLNGISGLILNALVAGDWANGMDALLSDENRRLAMAAAAPMRAYRFSQREAFAAFWDEHLQAARGNAPGPVETVSPHPALAALLPQ